MTDSWAEVRRSNSAQRYVIMAGDEKLAAMELVSTGGGNFDEFYKSFQAAEADRPKTVLMGGLKVTAIDEQGSALSIRDKFVVFSMLPESIPPTKRGKASALRTSVLNSIFVGTHVTFDISSSAEITQSEVVSRLNAVAGAHKPNRYEFESESCTPSRKSRKATEGDPEPHKEEDKKEEKASEEVPVPPNEKKPTEVLAPLDGTTSDLWNAVRTDSSPDKWVICMANERMTDIFPVMKGTGGFDDFLAALQTIQDRSQSATPLFAGFRLAAMDESGGAVSVRYKFISVALVPDAVPPMKRGKTSTVRTAALNAFEGTHATFDISAADELTRERLESRLQAVAGAHKPSRYDFTGEIVVVQRKKEEKEEAKQGDDPLPKTDETEEKVKTPTEPQPKGEEISVMEAWRRVRDDKDPVNYVIVGYDGKNPDTAYVVKCAQGNLQNFASGFDCSQVQFGGFRLRAIDDRGSVQSVRAKIVFVASVGANVGPVVRARAGTVKSHFENLLSGAHVTYFSTNIEADLTEDDLIAKLQASGGAHTPNRYDFSGKKGLDE